MIATTISSSINVKPARRIPFPSPALGVRLIDRPMRGALLSPGRAAAGPPGCRRAGRARGSPLCCARPMRRISEVFWRLLPAVRRAERARAAFFSAC